MDYYQNAVETERAAYVLNGAGIYRQAIYMCCLTVELYLKSRLYLVEHNESLAFSHNIINIYHALNSKFEPSVNIINAITRCRKYFNESRYPYAGDTDVYTKEFAAEFIDLIDSVKKYVDVECVEKEG